MDTAAKESLTLEYTLDMDGLAEIGALMRWSNICCRQPHHAVQ